MLTDAVKRVFDLLLCTALMPAAVAICLLVMPLIWIETGTTPWFAQQRVGRGQQPFRMIKLRTMRADTVSAASHLTAASQITRSGQWLRRLKLDELPQLLNVFTGAMSFVGPRPCLSSQTTLIEAREKLGVYVLRPGITGPAQVRGIDMSTPELLAALDATYLQPWSACGDLTLLRLTAFGGGRGDAVRGSG
ncbi:sugar transferase [Sphingomonas sp.]|uniref:sugar transferase n=1 Tax=Sphingomonas sp. TaxID=28214 RepID=UPI003CC52319